MPCPPPRQYVITAPSNGDMVQLLFNRADDGTPNAQSVNATAVGIARPSVKQSGSANPLGAVDFFWSESAVDPALADAVCIGVLIQGSSNAEINVGDMKEGYFLARTSSGEAIELHISERRL